MENSGRGRKAAPLTIGERRAFSALLPAARHERGWSRARLANEASPRLKQAGSHLAFDLNYIRGLEAEPAEPFASPHRLVAVLRALDLTMRQAFEACGVSLGEAA